MYEAADGPETGVRACPGNPRVRPEHTRTPIPRVVLSHLLFTGPRRRVPEKSDGGMDREGKLRGSSTPVLDVHLLGNERERERSEFLGRVYSHTKAVPDSGNLGAVHGVFGGAHCPIYSNWSWGRGELPFNLRRRCTRAGTAAGPVPSSSPAPGVRSPGTVTEIASDFTGSRFTNTNAKQRTEPRKQIRNTNCGKQFGGLENHLRVGKI